LRESFYWTGGTLLAERYLHHRKSYDIDLFSDKKFSLDEVLPVVHQVKEKTRLEIVEQYKVHDRWEFFIHNHEELRFEFVHYDFPPLKPREEWMGVYVDSLEDIGANKVIASVDRQEPKDVVDIYFLTTQAQFTLEKLLALAKVKFGLQMNEHTFMSELLVGSQGLKSIKPLIFGSGPEQEETLARIQEYFNSVSADRLHRLFNGDMN